MTVPGALLESTPMAIHSAKPHHGGLLDSLMKSVLGSWLPQGVQGTQSTQNSNTWYLCKMSTPMDGFHNFFWCWQDTIPNFFLTQLYLITNVYHRRTVHKNYKRGHSCKEYFLFGWIGNYDLYSFYCSHRDNNYERKASAILM